MPTHSVLIENTGERYACGEQETVLVGMERLGKRGIPVGCRGGGCGVCKIEVVSGRYNKRRMSREHISAEDESCGRVLACRISPAEDLVIRVVGLMKKNIDRMTTNQNLEKTC